MASTWLLNLNSGNIVRVSILLRDSLETTTKPGSDTFPVNWDMTLKNYN